MSKIISYELTEDKIEIETTGDLKYMPVGTNLVTASFGQFERTKNSTLLYTAEVLREKDGSLSHDPESEYADDLNELKSGRVKVWY